jgi:transcriptional regulator with XRE-family HTH domain
VGSFQTKSTCSIVKGKNRFTFKRLSMVEVPLFRAGEAALRKEIGQRFGRFRTAIGKTQARLARELGVYQTTITNIERGKVFPRHAYLVHLYHVYNLDVGWLVLGTGEIFVHEGDRSIASVSKLPCHIGRDDPRYQEYLELMRFMQVPAIEVILLGKLMELKLVARSEIEEFLSKQNRASQTVDGASKCM